jgi:hypothetical protein
VSSLVPDGVDQTELAELCLALADDALVSAQRPTEWTTRAPELEEEVALANIGLDLLGQSRLLYARCGQVDGTGRGEDAYAYFRDADDFRNVRLAELPNGDFAFSIARLLVLSRRTPPRTAPSALRLIRLAPTAHISVQVHHSLGMDVLAHLCGHLLRVIPHWDATRSVPVEVDRRELRCSLRGRLLRRGP